MVPRSQRSPHQRRPERLRDLVSCDGWCRAMTHLIGVRYQTLRADGRIIPTPRGHGKWLADDRVVQRCAGPMWVSGSMRRWSMIHPM